MGGGVAGRPPSRARRAAGPAYCRVHHPDLGDRPDPRAPPRPRHPGGARSPPSSVAAASPLAQGRGEACEKEDEESHGGSDDVAGGNVEMNRAIGTDV